MKKYSEGSTKVEEKKISFFKKIKNSIFDLDSYQELAAEKISRTIGYIVLLMLIFGIVVSFAYTYKFSQIIKEAEVYINTKISEINYEDYKLTVKFNDNEKSANIITDNILVNKIIINTEVEDEEEIDKNIEEIREESNAILLLKDKIILKTALSTNTMEYSYKEISEKYNINNISKTELINILLGNEMKMFIISFFIVILIYLFIIYTSSVFIDILLLAILAYIVTRLSKIRLKYSALYNIAVYSLTLPIVLNIAYIIVNIFTGFTIEYFEIMYSAVASIYIIASILIIKADVIKKQLELNKIIEEQEKVKLELQKREEEKKEEQRKQEKDKNNKKEEKGDKDEGNTSANEPEGNNA